MIKIYLAGPFFNEKERNYIEIAANILRNQGYEVIVPPEKEKIGKKSKW